MRLRRYEVSAPVRDRFIAASLDCAEAAARLARDGSTDGELVERYTGAANRLLSMGELHIAPIEADHEPEPEFRDEAS